MPKKTKETKEKFINSVGRRREAVARIRLYKGKGETIVNGKPIGQYFPGKVFETLYTQPLAVVEGLNKYYATIICTGGGKKGQLEAVIHGLARALAKADPEKFKPVLKKNGFLTRDARSRQRRMVGMGGKARRKKQSPKR
jgi:small subunit ribosomal protein S9